MESLTWLFQLILNPIRDWNSLGQLPDEPVPFQLILNPIRDWNPCPNR